MKLTNNIPKDSGFKIPEGYFASSKTCIKDRIALEKPLGREVSSGFIVPEDYFEDTISSIKNQTALEHILGKKTTSGFITPDTYFKENITNIKSRIDVERKVAYNEDVFDIPEEYFDTLNKKLNIEVISKEKDSTHLTISKKESKVISLKRYLSPAIGIAASLLLLVGIFLTQDKTTVNTENIELAAITDYFDIYDETLYNTELEELLTEEDLLSLENDVAIEEDVLIDYLEDRTDSYDYYLQ